MNPLWMGTRPGADLIGGNYFCRCAGCGLNYFGHKYGNRCNLCKPAVPAAPPVVSWAEYKAAGQAAGDIE